MQNSMHVMGCFDNCCVITNDALKQREMNCLYTKQNKRNEQQIIQHRKKHTHKENKTEQANKETNKIQDFFFISY